MTNVVETKIVELETRKTELVKNIQTRENELKQLYANLNAFNGAIAAMEELRNETADTKECVCEKEESCTSDVQIGSFIEDKEVSEEVIDGTK